MRVRENFVNWSKNSLVFASIRRYHSILLYGVICKDKRKFIISGHKIAKFSR